MKFKKIFLTAMPVITLSTGLAASLTSCGNSNNTKLPTVEKHTINNAFVNLLNSDDDGKLWYTTSKYGRVEVHHFNGSKIGYINVDDYVNNLMQFKDIMGDSCENYESTTSNYKTIITNHNNGSIATIDYENQVIKFSDYDMFGCEEVAYKTNPLAVGAGGGEEYYQKKQVSETETSILWDNEYTPPSSEYIIDLSKYNIKAYYYENKGYLPYDLFRNILNRNTLYTMFYDGVNFYEVSTYNNANTIDLYEPIRSEATILTSEYMEYTYNLLALTLDHRFGLDTRVGRSPTKRGQTITYFSNGAYERLAPYHDALISLDPDVANDALYAFFTSECDDGGHAGYRGLDILCTRPHARYSGVENAFTSEVFNEIVNARSAMYKDNIAKVAAGDLTYVTDPALYWAWTDPSVITDSYVPEDFIFINEDDTSRPIMYITFDGFNAVDRYYWDESKAGYIKYDNVNDSNYHYDTIRMTMRANQLINEYKDTSKHDHPIKDVVVDLTNNGGGTVYTEHVIASWLCGGEVKETIWNPHTKAFAKYSVKADLNHDGKVEKDVDYLDPAINLFLITSEGSFSCANMLPCNIVDNRPNNTYYIGAPSGGGACFVDGDMHIGLGNIFRSSSNYHMLRNDSTLDYKHSVDSGHLPYDTGWWYPIAWNKAYDYMDRKVINEKIRKLNA